MRILDDKSDKKLDTVTLFLTQEEALQLRSDLDQLLAKPKLHHTHLSSENYQKEITVCIYSNKLKSGNFDKEAPQNFCSERATIAERQGASENKHFEVKPMSSKVQISTCVSIFLRILAHISQVPV